MTFINLSMLNSCINFLQKIVKIFQSCFIKIVQVHSHENRTVKKCNYFLPRKTKSVSQNSLTFRGTKMWNEINEELRNKKFNTFKKQLKQILLEQYENLGSCVKSNKACKNIYRNIYPQTE